MEYDEEKFRRIVIETLRIPEHNYKSDLKLGDVQEWDSIAHLDLVYAIEQAFNFRLSTDDIVALTGLAELRARVKQAVQR